MAVDSDRFVLEANIEKYRNLLKIELAPATRATVLDLLAEAEEALRALDWPRRAARRQVYAVALCCLTALLAQLA